MLLGQPSDGERREAGDEQHLQEVAGDESGEERRGDDVEEEGRHRLRLGALGVALRDLGVESGGVNVEAHAGLEPVHHHEADDERERGDDLEVEQRLDAHAPQLLHVLHGGDAVDDGAEDDGRNHHLDQLDEGVAQRLERLAEVRVTPADHDAERDGQEHLHVEDAIPGRARGGSESWFGGVQVGARLIGFPPACNVPTAHLNCAPPGGFRLSALAQQLIL